MDPVAAKKDLRRDLFSRVKVLTLEQKRTASQAIVTHLQNADFFRSAEVVFSYLSMSSEPELEPLFENCTDKTWGFSRVNSDETLSFHHLTSLDQTERSSYGFLEPSPQSTILAPTDAEVIIVPGVGFDKTNGARLGRGKGHYDRFLEPVVSSPRPPILVGTCFFTQVASLIPESHDIPMNYLVTEQGMVTL
ncbi:MAG: 5-formyltetrahydrofolate cyclo-ligase [Verrucomicrobiota bacterium]